MVEREIGMERKRDNTSGSVKESVDKWWEGVVMMAELTEAVAPCRGDV